MLMSIALVVFVSIMSIATYVSVAFLFSNRFLSDYLQDNENHRDDITSWFVIISLSSIWPITWPNIAWKIFFDWLSDIKNIGGDHDSFRLQIPIR